jgi:hypothetical protein
LNNFKWDVSNSVPLTFSFPAGTFAYTTAEGYSPTASGFASLPFSGFQDVAFNSSQVAEIGRALNLIASYTNLTFTRDVLDDALFLGTTHAALRFADSARADSADIFSDTASGSVAPLAEDSNGNFFWNAGDVFFGPSTSKPTMGTFASETILREIGHALGLNDSHDSNGSIDPQLDDCEFSLMNTPSFLGGPEADTAAGDSSPQSFMMLDIAALQTLYGANFSNTGKNLIFEWNPISGQESISDDGGSTFKAQGAPVTRSRTSEFTGVSGNFGMIFETVWTGGANSTYDLRGFDEAFQDLDMRPGHSMMFSQTQLATLKTGIDSVNNDGIPVNRAQGNVYNALVINGDLLSEINNIITGNGDSTIVTGNDVFNTITLGNGFGDRVTIGSAGALVNCGSGSVQITTSRARSIINGGGKTALSYSWDTNSNQFIIVNVQTTFDPLLTDNFTNVQSFTGTAGSDDFTSGVGNFTFNGGSGGRDTLDYSWDQADLTVDLSNPVGSVQGTVDKGWLKGTYRDSVAVWQGLDSISGIANFNGGSGKNTFIGTTGGGFNFSAPDGTSNTLDYSHTPSFEHFNLVIDVKEGTATHFDSGGSSSLDTFENIQQFIGGGGDDTIVDGDDTFPGGPGTHSFDGRGGTNTAVFHDNFVAYAVTPISGGWHVVDTTGSSRDEPIDLVNVPHLKFKDVEFMPQSHTVTVTHRQSFAAASLFTAVGGNGMTKYAFWDGGIGGGHVVLNGVAQGTNQEIDVSAELSQLTYQSGSGADTLWVRAFDGTQWTAYTVNAPIDKAPAVTTSDLKAQHGQSFAASSLFTLSDGDGDSMTTYAFWDSGAGGARFILDGVTQAASHEFDVTAAQLSRLVYQSGSGPDTLWVGANDGILWGGWSNACTVNAPIDKAPVVTASNVVAAHGQSFAASSLFSASDADGDTITKYAFWNSGTGGGHFVPNGVAQGTSQEIDVSASQLSQLTYQSGSGADTLWVRANDGILWGNWPNGFTVTAPIDAAPVVTVSNLTATHGQLFAAASLFAASDPDGDPIITYAFWNSGTGGGHFMLKGLGQGQGTSQEIDVSARSLSAVSYQSGSGTDTLWVRAYDGTQWSNWSNSFTVTAPIDSGPTVTPTNDSIKSFPNQTFAASSLISYSDPFNSPATQYDFWNIGTGGGHFLLNGSALPANQDNIISSGQLSQLTYQVGTGSDTLWARANDGTVWGGWSKSFTISDPPAVGAGETITLGSAYAGEVNFLGDTGTLRLEDSSSFSGTVAGLHSSD